LRREPSAHGLDPWENGEGEVGIWGSPHLNPDPLPPKGAERERSPRAEEGGFYKAMGPARRWLRMTRNIAARFLGITGEGAEVRPPFSAEVA